MNQHLDIFAAGLPVFLFCNKNHPVGASIKVL